MDCCNLPTSDFVCLVNRLADEQSLLRIKLEAIEQILSLNAAGWCAVDDYSSFQFQSSIKKLIIK